MHALISGSTGGDFALWWVFMKQRDRSQAPASCVCVGGKKRLQILSFARDERNPGLTPAAGKGDPKTFPSNH